MNKEEGQYKVGDVVVFEECWEDEAGGFHDESAEILDIQKDGSLKLEWLGVLPSVEDFLNGCSFKLKDISY